MWRAVPYAGGERFVALFAGSSSEPRLVGTSTLGDARAFESGTQSFEGMGWFRLGNYNLTQVAEAQQLEGVELTPGLARLVGVKPQAGEWFRQEDGPLVVVISHRLNERLGGRLGKTIVLGGKPYVVLGVMADGFKLPHAGPAGPTQTDVWLPHDDGGLADVTPGYFIYGRIRPGVSLAQAEADVRRIGVEIARADPKGHPEYLPKVEELRSTFNEEYRSTLVLLFVGSGILLLLTCGNVAGLLVARGVARSRDTAVRVALGATKVHLAATFVKEGLGIALLGGGLGIMLAIGLMRGIRLLTADFLSRSEEIRLDAMGVGFALGMAVLSGMLATLAPLWQALAMQPNAVLNDGARGSAGLRSRRLSRWLVTGEIGVAFMLLAVSLALVGEFQRIGGISPGFNPDDLVTFEVTLAEEYVANPARRIAHQAQLVQALEAIPGVEGAAFVNQIAMAGCCFSTSIVRDGKAENGERVSFLPVSSRYFATMKIPLRRGRVLTERDVGGDTLLAMINDAAAQRYWPGEDPLGAFARVGGPRGSRFQVVGVVGNVRNEKLNRPTVPEIYLSSGPVAVNPMHFVVRSGFGINGLGPEIRRAVAQIDSAQPVHQMVTMRDVIGRSLQIERMGSFLMGAFAIVALLMAALGVYGLMSYSVRQRTVEIGTRMALGAERASVLRLVLADGMRMAGVGVAGGLGVTVGVLWLLRRELGWGDWPGWAVLLAGGLVTGFAAAAAWYPAWRASLLSPMSAMREQTESLWRIWRPVVPKEEAASAEIRELPMELADVARRAESFEEARGLAMAAIGKALGAERVWVREGEGESWLKRRVESADGPVPLLAADWAAVQRWVEETGAAFGAEVAGWVDQGVRLAMPLRTKAGVNGILLVAGPDEYPVSAREGLAACAGQLALLLENGRLTARLVDQEKLRNDLELAAEVQQRLLPQRTPGESVGALAARSLAARTIGGDYYDYFEIAESRVAFAIADVAGKGVAAALLMSVLQASLRMIVSDGPGAMPQLAAKMNRFLYRSSGSSRYATFFYAELEPGKLRYVNAGHNPPFLLRGRSCEIEELPAGGTVIGLFPEMTYKEDCVAVESGDVLLAFTDGVTEALNEEGEEYGEERLQGLLRLVGGGSVGEMEEAIAVTMREWMGTAEQYDDLTYVILKVG